MLGQAINVEKLNHAQCELNAKAHEVEKVATSNASEETSNQPSSPSVEEKVIERVNV